jgi:hypothetical protein
VGAALPNITAGERAVCTLSSAAGGWTRETETFSGGVVLNATAVLLRAAAAGEPGKHTHSPALCGQLRRRDHTHDFFYSSDQCDTQTYPQTDTNRTTCMSA